MYLQLTLHVDVTHCELACDVHPKSCSNIQSSNFKLMTLHRRNVLIVDIPWDIIEGSCKLSYDTVPCCAVPCWDTMTTCSESSSNNSTL